MNQTFSSYIITEAMLGVQCAEALLTEGHQILGVVSNNPEVIKWVRDHNIPYFFSLKEFEEIKPAKTFDYLFSIVNSQILPPQLLNHPRYYAINYHDAPLPKYAGVHATSWAILNNEKSHGVTWHIMSSLIDAGDILQQATFPIEPDETALTLNLKCYAQATEALKSLARDLAQGSIHKHSQDLQNRSYYGAYQKPRNTGLVNWNTSAQDIDRLHRALFFGDYPNNLASFKVLVDQQIIFPHKLKVLKEKTKAKAGTIVKIHINSLQVTTKTEDILIKDITDIQGNSCTISYLTNYFNLYEGYKLYTLDKRTQLILHQHLTTLSYHENYWVQTLLHSMPAKLFLISSACKKAKNKQVQKEQGSQDYSFITCKTNREMIKEASKKFKGMSFVDILSSTFMIYLSRLENKDKFRVNYTEPSLKQFTSPLDSFLSSEIFLTIDVSNSLTAREVVQRFIEEKVISIKHKTYSLDIKERHPILKKLPYDKPDIKINIGMPEEEIIERKEDYLLEIFVSLKGDKYSLAFSQELTEVEKQFITAIPDHINILLESLLQDPSRSIQSLPMLTPQEEHQILIEWNDTKAEYPEDKTLPQLFEEQVEKTPHNIAVAYEDQQLTYQQLNERANQLAHYLRGIGVGPDIFVAIAVERSLEMIIGLLGILKAGGAYVPLDPDYPQERLQFMLEDTQAPVLITQAHLQGKLKELLSSYTGQTVIVEHLEKTLHQQRTENLLPLTLPHHLAYVIYTSGSTGKPKGVLVSHYNIARLFFSTIQWYHFSQNDTWTLFHSYAFDFSVWEIWGSLLYGGKLIVVPYLTSRSPQAFYELLKNKKISVLNQTPSAFQQLIEYECSLAFNEKEFTPLSLRKVIFGGEVLDISKLKSWFENLRDRGCCPVNMYGITETTVHVTYWPLREKNVLNSNRNIIGRKIPDLQTYILDPYMNAVPVGVSGEIYIGGAGLARGYLNRPDLTAERFVPNSFVSEEDLKLERNIDGRGERSLKGRVKRGESTDTSTPSLSPNPSLRLYRTGDLARYLPDGNIEFLGRLDDQVKLRGFRIELGEIETILAHHKWVSQAVVSVTEKDNHKQLTGYIVPNLQTAYPVWKHLVLQREKEFSDLWYYELPNNLVIAHLNKIETIFCYKEIFEEKQYHKHGITINNGDCIFDVGANIGLFSLYASLQGDNITIYAFEPSKSAFKVLNYNMALYGVKAIVLNCALSNEAGNKVFTCYSNASLISGMYGNDKEEKKTLQTFIDNLGEKTLGETELENLLQQKLIATEYPVEVRTLSEIIEEHQIKQIDLLKIDVEKSEQDIIRGIKEEDWKKIKQLIIEVHDYNGRLSEIIYLLKEKGYNINVEQEAILRGTGLYNIYARLESKKVKKNTNSIQKRSIPFCASSKQLIVEVLNFLETKLPPHMIPSFFVFIDKVPLTPNGKIDRKALPAPDLSSRHLGDEYVAPQTPLEQQLCAIWTEVLKIEKISIHDNFFKLGGHSLLATQVISRIRHTYHIDLPLKALFEHPTISALKHDIEQLMAENNLSVIPAIIVQQRPDSLPLSFAQQRLWFLDQLLPDTALYNIPLALNLTGPLNLQAFEKTFNTLLTRHESLRTIFPVTEGDAYQLILPSLTIKIADCLVDLSSLSQEQQQESVEALAFQETNIPFNLSSGPLIRLKLLKRSSQEHVLLITMHHIVSDGWSMGVFFKELSELYNAYAQGQEPNLPPLPLQYADFSLWQRQWLQGEVLEAQLSYWKQQLADIPDLLELPTDRPRPKELTYKGASYYYTLPKEVKDQLNALSQQQGTSLFMTLLALFQVLLYRYTGQKDIVVGSPIANRHYKEIEGLIGFFVNTLALKTTFEGNESFLDILNKVKETTLQAYQHQDVPFEQLVDYLNITRALNRNPVFQVMFTLQNATAEGGGLTLQHIQTTPIFSDYPIAKFDLSIDAFEHEEGISIGFDYATDLFEEEAIKGLGSHFEILIKEALKDPSRSIQSFSLLTSRKRISY